MKVRPRRFGLGSRKWREENFPLLEILYYFQTNSSSFAGLAISQNLLIRLGEEEKKDD
jgi:hypothetical protein